MLDVIDSEKRVAKASDPRHVDHECQRENDPDHRARDPSLVKARRPGVRPQEGRRPERGKDESDGRHALRPQSSGEIERHGKGGEGASQRQAGALESRSLRKTGKPEIFGEGRASSGADDGKKSKSAD